MTNPDTETCYTCGGTKTANRTKDSEFGWRKDRETYRSSCKECVTKSARLRNKNDSQPDTRFYTLWCPNNEYPKDHRFSNGDFKATLENGLFTLGMIVSNRGKKHVVCGDGHASLKLKKLDYPTGTRFPKQWLTEAEGVRA